MAGDREFRAKFTADTSDLERGANRAEGSLKGVDDSTGNMGRNAAIAGTAIVALGAGLWTLAGGAAEDQRAQAALATTLGNVTGATTDQVAAVEAWISKQGTTLGITDDQLRPALDSLARSTKDVGEAQKLASLAMDISAGTGKDLTAVSDALGKAFNGNLAPLKKLDPALAAMIKSGASADEVFAALGQTFEGQAAKAAGTTAGQMQIAQLRLAELGETIGAMVIPVVTALASVFLDHVMPAIEAFVGFIGDHWEIVLAAITGLGVGVAVALVPAFIAWATTAGAAALATLAAAAPIIAVGLAVAGLAAGLMYAWQHSETFRTIVLEVWDKVKAAVEIAVGLVKIQIDVWKEAFDLAWGAVQTMWDIVGPLIDKVWAVVTNMVSLVKNIISGDWAAAFESLKATAKAGIDLVVDWFIGLPARIVTALVNLGSDLMGVATDALGAGIGFLGGLVASVGDLMGWFTSLPGKILGWIGDIASTFYNLGKTLIEQLIKGIGDLLGKLKSKVGDVVSALNPVKIAGDIGGAIGGALPFLASGGVADGWAVVGEQGPELIHVGSPSRVFNNAESATMLSSGARGGGGNVYHITLVNEAGSDPAEAGRRVVDAIAAFEQRAGAGWRAGSRAA